MYGSFFPQLLQEPILFANLVPGQAPLFAVFSTLGLAFTLALLSVFISPAFSRAFSAQTPSVAGPDLVPGPGVEQLLLDAFKGLVVWVSAALVGHDGPDSVKGGGLGGLRL